VGRPFFLSVLAVSHARPAAAGSASGIAAGASSNGNKTLIVTFCLLSVVVAGVLQMADGQILTIVPRLYTQSPGQKPQNGQPPRGPNALLPKKVIAVLQAAQLLPTD
jgi:hypothetical protein